MPTARWARTCAPTPARRPSPTPASRRSPPRSCPASRSRSRCSRPPEPLAARSEEEALAAIRPGIDGLILEFGGHRGTFLPQVWEQLADPREFLAHLKHKAGLPPAFWSPDIRLWRYTVAKWEEEEG